MSTAFRILTLASGSSGNAVYAEGAGGALLIDAGVSVKRIEAGLRAAGGDPSRVRGVVLTHDHGDHARSIGPFARRYGVPLFMTPGSADRCGPRMGRVGEVRLFPQGAVLELAGFRVHTVATPHDGAEPVAVVLESGGGRAGVLTDLGHPFPELPGLLATLDVALLESNYDPEMLRTGPYHEGLKRRIRSRGGHLSNDEAAALVRDHGNGRLRAVMLAHLSENNNRPELAVDCFRRVNRDRLEDGDLALHLAPRHGPSAVLTVERP